MLSDNDLIRAYANSGDEKAFAEIARRHGGMVYRACLRVLGDPHAAEDASQAVFEVLVRKARSLRRVRDLAAWLHGVARKAALMARRTASRRAKREEEVGMLRPSGAGPDFAEQQAIAELLDGELARLSRAERQAVILRHLEGRSEAESAEIAACPLGTLSRRASQGLARMRARFSGRGVSLSAGALAGALAVEAAASLPETLLPSMLVATKTAAVGAAGAVTGASLITEGVLKAMLWTKIKIAAAVLAAATVVAGVGTPLAVNAVAGGAREEEKPRIGATSRVIRARVKKVELARGLPPKAVITIDAGSERGVKKGFVFEVRRDGKLLNAQYGRALNIQAVAEKESTGTYLLASGLPVKPPRVGDIATTKLTVVDPKVAAPSPPPEAEVVNGLRLTIKTDYRVTMKPGKTEGRPCFGRSVFTCEVLEDKGDALLVNIYGGKRQRGDIRKADIAGMAADWTFQKPKLRWENVSKKPLVIYRDRCCDLYDHIFLKGPDGKLVPARTDNRERLRHLGHRPVRIEPGKQDEERFDPWHWVVKPERPGEYTLWVEFEQKFPPTVNMNAFPKGYWIGKIRSNTVTVTISAPPVRNVAASALAWLAKTQEADGHWDSAKHGARPADDVAATSAALLAYLGAGHTQKGVKHADNVKRALQWLVKQQDAETGAVGRSELSRLFASVALLESYGITRDKLLKGPSWKAYEWVHRSAAKKGGLRAQALAWSRISAKVSTGRQIDGQDARSAFIATFMGSGDTSFRKAKVSLPDEMLSYTSTLGSFQKGGAVWRKWYAKMRGRLLGSQIKAGKEAGSWNPEPRGDSTRTGRVLATALNTMALEVAYRYMPAHRTEQPGERTKPRPRPAPPVVF